MGIQQEYLQGIWLLPAGSSLRFQTTNPNFALLKNRNLLAHRATKLIHPATGPIGHQFIELATVDSTNNYAKAKVHEGMAVHGTAYFAFEQTGGRGQRGKSWNSQPGLNIILSVVLEQHARNSSAHFLLSMAMASGAIQFLRQFVPNGLTIKWPNDLYWEDRKLGGILIENIFKGKKLIYSIAGFGININQTNFEDWIPNPVSLNEITGNSFDPKSMALQLCQFLDKQFELYAGAQFELISKGYNESLYKKNQTVELLRGNERIKTKIKEVRFDGMLITEEPPGIYKHGEVEWLL